MTDRSITHATFSLERTYPVPPARVFTAWADPDVKVRWFSGNPKGYEMDFRPGGIERNSTIHEDKLITWESLYCEIVTDERIVYTSVLNEQDMVATVSMTTVELIPETDGTRLVLVEACAHLDGREQPAWREQGTNHWLDALGRHLEQGKQR
jgi:uncharacterized protein YndB with AHSA1/START domain